MLEILLYRLLSQCSTYKGNIRWVASNHTCETSRDDEGGAKFIDTGQSDEHLG